MNQNNNFTCSKGHSFSESESKEKINGAFICPICYPDGFLKDCNVKNKISDVDSCIVISKNIERIYEQKKEMFFKHPCAETRLDLVRYMEMLNIADQKVIEAKYSQ